MNWLSSHATGIALWAGALCTFAVYSILYTENRLYRLFEHIFIGLQAGYGVYFAWTQVLGPSWWKPMTSGAWYWAFAVVAGSMFYFMYSKKSVWISRIIFGFFMGYAAGGIFRSFYGVYFPQIRSSMKPLTGPGMTGWDTLNVVIFYVILISAMSYFLFSFDHKHKGMSRSSKLGRWFLMIGFGSIFGATVLGRMTLFVGRFNFLINDWWPQAASDAHSVWFWIVIPLIAAGLIMMLISSRRVSKGKAEG